MGTVQGTELHRLRGLHGRAARSRRRGGGEEGAAWLRGHWPQILESRCYRILQLVLLCFTPHKAAHQTKHFCSVTDIYKFTSGLGRYLLAVKCAEFCTAQI